MSDFKQRHIGPNESEKQKMIDTIGVSSIEELIDQTVPKKNTIGQPFKNK